MSKKPEALADRLDDERMNLIERLADENERLRELVRHILGDRMWVDEAHAALRREET